MINRRTIPTLSRSPVFISQYHDFGVSAVDITTQQRRDNAERAIQRFFAGSIGANKLEFEAIARFVSPGPDFVQRFYDELDFAQDGFAPQLLAPSPMVESAFRHYALTDLGAVTIKRLLRWDDRFIDRAWRSPNGELTHKGVLAYGMGMWRPFRVASHEHESDTVTPSGVLLLPDIFDENTYSTGDLAQPLAILHHELKAHILPLKEGIGLTPGPALELICLSLESESLRELGLTERKLHWGKDGGTLDHTLHIESKCYFQGLVRQDENGNLLEIDPDTADIKAAARIKSV